MEDSWPEFTISDETKNFWALLDDIEFNIKEARTCLNEEHEGNFRAHVNTALDRLYVLKRRVDNM